VRGAGFITSSGEIVEVNATFVPGSTGLPFDEYIRTPAGQNFLKLFVGTPEEQRDRAGQYSRTTPQETAIFGGQGGLFDFLNTPGTSIDLFRSDPALRARFDQTLATSGSVRIASAAFGGSALLGNLQASDPAEYARVVEQFGGNPQSAAIAYGLFERFRTDKLTFNIEIQRTISGLPEFDSIKTAVQAGVPRAADSIGGFLSDPIGSMQRGFSGMVDAVTNPMRTGQAISDKEFIANILLAAATLTGDDNLRRRVAADVGGTAVAIVVEARVGEAAVGGAARVARPIAVAGVDAITSGLQRVSALRATRAADAAEAAAIAAAEARAGAAVTPGSNVSAVLRIGNTVITDVNQTARVGVDATRPTAIADQLAAQAARNGRALPNQTLGNAHAEIGALQQAIDAGITTGQNAVLNLRGQGPCGFCDSAIPRMVQASGLNSLTINFVDLRTVRPVGAPESGTIIFERLPNGTIVRR
jgi:hypothetical protein